MIFHRACELVLQHCPLDTARRFAAQGLQAWEPDEQRTVARFLAFELKSWSTPLGKNLLDTFRRIGRGTLRPDAEQAYITLKDLGLEH